MLPYALRQFVWMLRTAAQLVGVMGTGVRWITQMLRLLTYVGCAWVFFIPHWWWYLTSPNVICHVSYRSSETTRRRNLLRMLEAEGVDFVELLRREHERRRRRHRRRSMSHTRPCTPLPPAAEQQQQQQQEQQQQNVAAVSSAPDDRCTHTTAAAADTAVDVVRNAHAHAATAAAHNIAPNAHATPAQQPQPQHAVGSPRVTRVRKQPPHARVPHAPPSTQRPPPPPPPRLASLSPTPSPAGALGDIRNTLERLLGPAGAQLNPADGSALKRSLPLPPSRRRGAPRSLPPQSPPQPSLLSSSAAVAVPPPSSRVAPQTKPSPGDDVQTQQHEGDDGSNNSRGCDESSRRSTQRPRARGDDGGGQATLPPTLDGNDNDDAGRTPLTARHTATRRDHGGDDGNGHTTTAHRVTMTGDHAANVYDATVQATTTTRTAATAAPSATATAAAPAPRRRRQRVHDVDDARPRGQQTHDDDDHYSNGHNNGNNNNNNSNDDDDEDEEDKMNLHNRATLDIFLPVPLDTLMKSMAYTAAHRTLRRKKFPVVIVVTGGAWIIGSHLWATMLARVLAARGYVVFCPDYRNFPQTTMEGMTLDVSDAIAWVLSNADRYNGDLDDVTLLGQSAGAHLTMLSLLSQAQLAAYEANGGSTAANNVPAPSNVAYNVARYNPRQSIHCYIGLSGVYNVDCLVNHFDQRGLYRGVLYKIAGGRRALPRYTISYYFDEYRKHETGEVLPDNIFDFLPRHMYLLHGDADKSAPISESARLVRAMRAAQEACAQRRRDVASAALRRRARCRAKHAAAVAAAAAAAATRTCTTACDGEADGGRSHGLTRDMDDNDNNNDNNNSLTDSVSAQPTRAHAVDVPSHTSSCRSPDVATRSVWCAPVCTGAADVAVATSCRRDVQLPAQATPVASSATRGNDDDDKDVHALQTAARRRKQRVLLSRDGDDDDGDNDDAHVRRVHAMFVDLATTSATRGHGEHDRHTNSNDNDNDNNNENDAQRPCASSPQTPRSPVLFAFVRIPGAGHTDTFVEECITKGRSCCVDFMCDYEPAAVAAAAATAAATTTTAAVVASACETHAMHATNNNSNDHDDCDDGGVGSRAHKSTPSRSLLTRATSWFARSDGTQRRNNDNDNDNNDKVGKHSRRRDAARRAARARAPCDGDDAALPDVVLPMAVPPEQMSRGLWFFRLLSPF